MLDGVLHYRLKRQRRYAKRRERRIKADRQSVFKLRLLDCEICAGVLQLVAERDHVLTGDGGEILPQVKREVKRDLLRLGGILIASDALQTERQLYKYPLYMKLSDPA